MARITKSFDFDLRVELVAHQGGLETNLMGPATLLRRERMGDYADDAIDQAIYLGCSWSMKRPKTKTPKDRRFTLELVWDNPKAILVRFPGSKDDFWLPKSQITWGHIEDTQKQVSVLVPGWLIKKKNLNTKRKEAQNGS